MIINSSGMAKMLTVEPYKANKPSNSDKAMNIKATTYFPYSAAVGEEVKTEVLSPAPAEPVPKSPNGVLGTPPN